MNIGIIGINIHTADLNPGAVLHAWAFQKYIVRFNEIESADIIDYIPQHVKGRIGSDLLKQYLKQKDLRNAVKSIIYRRDYLNRFNKFNKFVETQMSVSKDKFDSYDDWGEVEEKYQCLIVESDVVWAKHNGEFNRVFFLNLPDMKNVKRIAYATDIGNLEIRTQAEESEFVELLSSVEYISCRGKHSEAFLKQYTDKNVVPLIDPTLLLNTSDYDTICSPCRRKSKYLYCYYIDYDKELIHCAKEYAKKHGLKYIEATSRITKENILEFDRNAYNIGVEDFVSEIKYADVVMTNSFHACCVSIQYHKSFYAFPRRDEYKVYDLVKQMQIQDRYVANYTIDNEFDIDYRNVDLFLSKEREKSQIWLSKALGIKISGSEASLT